MNLTLPAFSSSIIILICPLNGYAVPSPSPFPFNEIIAFAQAVSTVVIPYLNVWLSVPLASNKTDE